MSYVCHMFQMSQSPIRSLPFDELGDQALFHASEPAFFARAAQVAAQEGGSVDDSVNAFLQFYDRSAAVEGEGSWLHTFLQRLRVALDNESDEGGSHGANENGCQSDDVYGDVDGSDLRGVDHDSAPWSRSRSGDRYGSRSRSRSRGSNGSIGDAHARGSNLDWDRDVHARALDQLHDHDPNRDY